MSDKVAPYNEISWVVANPLTTTFVAFVVYARPRFTPAPPWFPIGYIDVPTWSTPTVVEAQCTKFRDYMAGWNAGGFGPFAAGWDYLVTEKNNKNMESRLYGSTVQHGAPNADDVHWYACNQSPYLNCPAPVLSIDSKDNSDPTDVIDGLTGRDYAFTRTRMERAGRVSSVDWYYHSLNELSEERARWPKALAETGRTTALLVPRGDRYIGTLKNLDVKRTNSDGTSKVDVSGDFVETADWQAANYNLPCGPVLNGTNQYITTPSTAVLNPGTAAFSIVQAAIFPSASGKVHYSKGNIGTASSYGFRNPSANVFSFYVKGATTVLEASWASFPFADGLPHVAVGTYDGAVACLYVDGVLVAASKGVAGAVTNSVALSAGANNATTASSALAPYHGHGHYGRRLTPTEAEACGYLLGWSGRKLPGGATFFYDSRDDRCWSGYGSVLEDLAGNFLRATIVGSPTTRGIPWRLRELDTLTPVV